LASHQIVHLTGVVIYVTWPEPCQLANLDISAVAFETDVPYAGLGL